MKFPFDRLDLAVHNCLMANLNVFDRFNFSSVKIDCKTPTLILHQPFQLYNKFIVEYFERLHSVHSQPVCLLLPIHIYEATGVP